MKKSPETKSFNLYGKVRKNGPEKYVVVSSTIYWGKESSHAYDLKTAKRLNRFLSKAIKFMEKK